jgi:phosphopantothenoylcysteine decarboxylase
VANVLLGVTGSVAAIKTPSLYRELRSLGHQVKVVATQAALYFFDPTGVEFEPSGPGRNPEVVILDEDEWPGRHEGRRYRRDDPVLHIELRRWADLLLIAPLDANTLGKLACGLADNCLTCVWRAWDPVRPVVLAPAMNTFMWQNPLTARHLRQLAADAGGQPPPPDVSFDQLVPWINAHSKAPPLRVVGPVSRRLACGDVGVGALAPLEQITAVVGAIDRDEWCPR